MLWRQKESGRASLLHSDAGISSRETIFSDMLRVGYGLLCTILCGVADRFAPDEWFGTATRQGTMLPSAMTGDDVTFGFLTVGGEHARKSDFDAASTGRGTGVEEREAPRAG